jgi:hypothetical protein
MELYVSDERVAALEAHRQGDQAAIEKMAKQLDHVAADVSEIKLGLAKQKGFLAGVLAVLLPIWTFITIAVGSVWEWYQGGGSQ